jgi:hypothetical protein
VERQADRQFRALVCRHRRHPGDARRSRLPGRTGELYERADPEREKWRAFFAVWHPAHADKPVGVGDVADLASECDVISEDTRGARNALGRMIRGKCDRHFRGTQTHLRRHEPPGRTIPGEIK